MGQGKGQAPPTSADITASHGDNTGYSVQFGSSDAAQGRGRTCAPSPSPPTGPDRCRLTGAGPRRFKGSSSHTSLLALAPSHQGAGEADSGEAWAGLSLLFFRCLCYGSLHSTFRPRGILVERGAGPGVSTHHDFWTRSPEQLPGTVRPALKRGGATPHGHPQLHTDGATSHRHPRLHTDGATSHRHPLSTHVPWKLHGWGPGPGRIHRGSPFSFHGHM